MPVHLDKEPLPLPIPTQVSELQRWLGVLTPREEKSLKLTAKRRQILLLHLAGLPAQEISEQLNTPVSNIYHTVNSKEAQRVFDDFIRYNDSELRSLRGLAIQAVRDALQPNQDIETRLRAADKIFKSQGDYSEGKELKQTTAEDVIRRVLEYQSGGVTLRMEESRPARKDLPDGK